MKHARAYRENSFSVVGHTNRSMPPTRSTKHMFLPGPSRYKFDDEQQREEEEEEIGLLIQ